MIDTEASKLITGAVEEELEHIRAVHGNQYNSLHEGYAVLLEEVEEAENELERVKEELSDLWLCIKQNDNEGATNALRRIATHSHFLIQESVQVAAVTNKFRGIA